jgi:glycerophosphoryl diester phosphodiesterase
VAIELKDPASSHPHLAAAVLDLAETAGMLDSVLVLSFDHAHLGVARARAAEVPRVALTVEPPADPATWLGDRDADVLGQLAERIDAELCAAVHAAGARLLAWTVDDGNRLGQLVAMGCDIVVSNRPGVMTARLSRMSAAGGSAPERAAGPASADR